MPEPISLSGLGIDSARIRSRTNTAEGPPCLQLFSELQQEPSHRRYSADMTHSIDQEQERDYASLRSTTSMKGLLAAEHGAAMVELDLSGYGFKTGQHIVLDEMSSPHRPSLSTHPTDCRPSEDVTLSRHGTLLTVGASSGRNAAELKSILGNSNARLKPNAIIEPTSTRTSQADRTVLEQAKPRARVEVDIILHSKTIVEGGYLQGSVKIRVRKTTRKESPVLISGGKIRLIGFECINGQGDRHTFYQASTFLSDICDDHAVMYDSPPDTEGFCQAKDGVYIFPFSMELPLDGDGGKPKGVLYSHSALTVRYIAMFSIKVKERDTGRRSIAHFYRDCELWPRLNPSLILAPAPSPISNTVIKSLFMGGSGKVTLLAALHRLHWVAGQQCSVKAHITNYSKQTIKSITISLYRRTVIFKPRPSLDVDHQQDNDACQTTTTERQVAESTLRMGQRGARGHASAKGWWTGVSPGETQECFHFIPLPPDALSMPRGRFLEVEYELRVSVSAGPLGSDILVALPIKIVNFLSIDPPPTYPLQGREMHLPISSHYTTRDSEAFMIGAMLQSLEESEEEEQDEELISDESNGDISLDVDGAYDGVYGSSQSGSLPMAEDTDDVLRHVISSVRIDAQYDEHGNRLAGSYDASHPPPGPLDGIDVPDEVLVADTDRDTPRPSAEDLILTAPRGLGYSSFAQRVQEKMQAAGEMNGLTRINTGSTAVSDGSSVKSLPMEKSISSNSSGSGCTCGLSRGSSMSSGTSVRSFHGNVQEEKDSITISVSPFRAKLSQPPHPLPVDSFSGPAPSPEPLAAPLLPSSVASSTPNFTSRPRGKTVSEAAAQFERQLPKEGPSASPGKIPSAALPSPEKKRAQSSLPEPIVVLKELAPLSVKDKIRQLEQKQREGLC